MARGEHEPVVSHAARDPRRCWLDDLLALHFVDEAAVRHLDDDLVAALELVELVERRAVRRAMARDRDGPVDAGERRLRIVARPFAQRTAVRSLDHHLVDAYLRDADAADRVAHVCAALESAREERGSLAVER